MKNAFIAAFGAVYFFVAWRVFKCKLLSKRFFGVEFRFWGSAARFQFILVKKTKRVCLTNYGHKDYISLCALYKSLKYQLSQIEFQKEDRQ